MPNTIKIQEQDGSEYREVSLDLEPVISFGPFRLLPLQRLLLEGDKQVRLGSRALDILIALIEKPGELIDKGELMAGFGPTRSWKPPISQSTSRPCGVRSATEEEAIVI